MAYRLFAATLCFSAALMTSSAFARDVDRQARNDLRDGFQVASGSAPRAPEVACQANCVVVTPATCAELPVQVEPAGEHNEGPSNTTNTCVHNSAGDRADSAERGAGAERSGTAE